MAKILVTGATGFVGKRLILNLISQGHEVYALCHIQGSRIFSLEIPNLHYIYGDIKNSETLNRFPTDIDAAYYLVHSMTDIVNNLVDTEKKIAEDFAKALKKTKVQQIIYLGGIINDPSKLSVHLQSRLIVEEALKQSSIPVTVLRASIIIGSGSASFEIIRDLCEKLPIMIAPRWVHSQCQPIAIPDVLFYLSQVLLNKDCYNKTFDIGGPEVLTFKQLLEEYSRFRDLKRWIIDVPLLTPRLSSYWLVFITSVKLSLCKYLVESMTTNSVVQNTEIQTLILHQCLSYREALELAFKNIAQNEVTSTWMDSWEISNANPDIKDFIEVPKEGCLKDVRQVDIHGFREEVIDRIWKIGGDAGYYGLTWAWHIRGLVDKFVGGVGLNRGRRHPSELVVGDSIDFWRVLLTDKEKGHLILYSTMKMPGEAWLEFETKEVDEKLVLVQTATFRPHGLTGRLYWYTLLPFHYFIFNKMAQSIADSSN